MGGLESLDCEMNGAALPKGWQRQWLMGWNGISTGSQRTFFFFATPKSQVNWLTSPGFDRCFPYKKTFRFVGETGMFFGRFLGGFSPAFFPSWIFGPVVPVGSLASKKPFLQISHKRMPRVSATNGSTQRVAGVVDSSIQNLWKQLRNPKTPFLNVRIRMICWNTKMNCQLYIIVSYFSASVSSPFETGRVSPWLFHLPFTGPWRNRWEDHLGPKSYWSLDPGKSSNLETWKLKHLCALDPSTSLAIGFLDVEFVTGDCEWKGWGLGWKLMKRRLNNSSAAT